MRVLGLHHVSVVVADTRRSLAFYCGVLGLQQASNRPQLGFPGAWIDLNGQQIHLLELPNPDSTSERPEHVGRDRHMALLVSDLTPYSEALRAADVAVQFSRSGRRALFCRDPDGNGVELIEAGAGGDAQSSQS